MFHAEKVCENFDLNHFWGMKGGRYSIKRGLSRGITGKLRRKLVS